MAKSEKVCLGVGQVSTVLLYVVPRLEPGDAGHQASSIDPEIGPE
jgi:hypothetical protein